MASHGAIDSIDKTASASAFGCTNAATIATRWCCVSLAPDTAEYGDLLHSVYGARERAVGGCIMSRIVGSPYT